MSKGACSCDGEVAPESCLTMVDDVPRIGIGVQSEPREGKVVDVTLALAGVSTDGEVWKEGSSKDTTANRKAQESWVRGKRTR